MNPDAVPYAVSKKLLDRVRIRHDWAAMFVSIKGDDEEYFVDIKVIVLDLWFIALSFVFLKNKIK